MLKPDSLRTALAAAVPALATDPDRLLIFVENGTLAASIAPGFSFEYRYQLNLILTDFAGHPDTIMVPLLVWLARHQPELLANPDRRTGIRFDVEVMANNMIDLSMTLELTERVGVNPRAGGGFDVEHYPEPELEAPLQVEHWRIWLKDELVAEWRTDE